MEKDFGHMFAMVNNEVRRVPLENVAGKLKTVDPNAQIVKEAKLLPDRKRTRRMDFLLSDVHNLPLWQIFWQS